MVETRCQATPPPSSEGISLIVKELMFYIRWYLIEKGMSKVSEIGSLVVRSVHELGRACGECDGRACSVGAEALGDAQAVV